MNTYEINVKQIIKDYENEQNYDEMVGWTNGLNEINQKKNYVSGNAVFYEKSAKKGIHNHGHMKVSLMLHYVREEEDFDKWWQEHDTTYFVSGY